MMMGMNYRRLMAAIAMASMVSVSVAQADMNSRQQKNSQASVDVVRSQEIIGRDVRNPQNERLGHITELVVDQGRIVYAVLETDSVLGFGRDLVAVPFDRLAFSSSGKHLVLDISEDRLDSIKGFDRNNWPTEAHEIFYGGSANSGSSTRAASAQAEMDTDPEFVHLTTIRTSDGQTRRVVIDDDELEGGVASVESAQGRRTTRYSSDLIPDNAGDGASWYEDSTVYKGPQQTGSEEWQVASREQQSQQRSATRLGSDDGITVEQRTTISDTDGPIQSRSSVALDDRAEPYNLSEGSMARADSDRPRIIEERVTTRSVLEQEQQRQQRREQQLARQQQGEQTDYQVYGYTEGSAERLSVQWPSDRDAAWQHKVTEIVDADVETPMGAELGEVEEVMIDMRNGQLTFAILDPEIAFNDDLVVVPYDSLELQDQDELAYLEMTREQLAQAPSFDDDTWPDMAIPSYRDSVFAYYGLQPYDTTYGFVGDRSGTTVTTQTTIDTQRSARKQQSRDMTRTESQRSQVTLGQSASGSRSYADLYQPGLSRQVEGEVIAVERRNLGQYGQGIVATVRSQDGAEQQLVVGPTSYLDQHSDLSIQVGDQLRATAAPATVDDRQVLIIKSLEQDGSEITLIRDDGRGIWE